MQAMTAPKPPFLPSPFAAALLPAVSFRIHAIILQTRKTAVSTAAIAVQLLNRSSCSSIS